MNRTLVIIFKCMSCALVFVVVIILHIKIILVVIPDLTNSVVSAGIGGRSAVAVSPL